MDNPIEIFADWFLQAKKYNQTHDATAMALATANKNGEPSVRIVLLKNFDERGFVFYTNMDSRKSSEIKENATVSLCFYWQPIAKQVRIYGKCEKVSDIEADEYYNSRPFISRIGAIASQQSQPLKNRAEMMDKVKELEAIYNENNPPKRPPNWSGWRVKPNKIELWSEGDYRLHDRNIYTRTNESWIMEKLYP